MPIPDLFCPFPVRVHPAAAAVDTATLVWAQRRVLIPPAPAHPLYHLKIGWLAAHTHPQAAVAGVQLVADWCSWLFVHDDFCDESSLALQPDQLTRWHHQLTAIMAGEPAHTSEGLIGAFADLWQRTLAQPAASAAWRAHFRAQLVTFFRAASWEAHHRASGHIPALPTYLQQRPLTSGMYVFIALIDVIHAIEFPLSLAHHPHLRAARDATARAACWVNDLLSYPKEAARGDPNNLVIVLANAYQESPHLAMARAATLHDADVRQFLAIEAQHMDWPAAVRLERHRYFAVLRSYMRGNYDWTRQSARYLAVRAVSV